MPVRSSALVTVVIAAASWAEPVAAAGAERLRISGTGTSLGVVRQLAAAFEKAHPGQTVKLLPSLGSSGAIKAVAEGALEIGVSGRPLRAEERARGLRAQAFARTPFLFAVGPRVEASSITPADLVRIYRGEALEWPAGGRIRLVLRPRADADTQFIRDISPEFDEAMEMALTRPGMIMAATNQDCAALLASTPGAIGPSSLTQLITEAGPLRALAWNGVPPTLENLASGSYPLVKTLHLVVRAEPPPAIRAFVGFVGSPEGLRVLARTGNLPLDQGPIR